MQVTRDKLLREHLYNERVDIGRETGSGYPAGIPCMTALSQYMPCTPDFGCRSGHRPQKGPALQLGIEVGLMFRSQLSGDVPTVKIVLAAAFQPHMRCADPETKAWLQKHVDRVFGFPNLVRFSWATCARILDTSAVPVHW